MRQRDGYGKRVADEETAPVIPGPSVLVGFEVQGFS